MLTTALLAVAACGGDDEPEAGSQTEAVSTETAPRDFRVAILFPGTENDGNWGEGWCTGVKQAATDLGIESTCAGSLDTPDQYRAQGSSFASAGFDFIIIANGAVGEVPVQLAQQFPDTLFCAAPIQLPDEDLAELPSNLCYLDIEQQNAAFLGGVVAGLVTKTNKIAAVNGFAFPALTRQPEAFSLGARCVNPATQFSERYINSWDDAALGKAAAETMIARGADVILAPVIGATLGVYEAARGKPGTWVIPEYFDANDQAPNVVLTTVLFDLPHVAGILVERGIRGELEGSNGATFVSFDLLDTELIAPFYEDEEALTEQDRETLEEIKRKVIAGEIKVPDETVGSVPLGSQGAATKIDPKTLGC